MYTIAISLTILALIVLLLLLIEIRSYTTGRTLISRRRLVLRIIAGLLLLSLFAAVFVGLFILRLTGAQARPQLFITYWSSCLLVAVVLVWVMLADLQEVEERASQRKHEMWRDMAQFVAGQIKSADQPKAEPGPEDDDPK
ncbi:MAG TPA: hypothetical protein VMY35_15140 [Phycisphaerae bacterium]|nr:hypothetical protein [Phycisphaerae bacterium]